MSTAELNQKVVRRPNFFHVSVELRINAVEAAVGTTEPRLLARVSADWPKRSIGDVVVEITETRVTAS